MNLLRFDSPAAWTACLASLWRDRLRVNPRLRQCLPAGNTPKPVFAAMLESVRRGQVSFRESEIFMLDEYGDLAPDDPGRCANTVRHCLVDHIDVGAFQFLDTTAPDLDAVCRAYETAIGPGFDLAILGVGLNGHLGLNEPGSAPGSLTRRIEMHPASVAASQQYLTHAHTPTWGATVGLKRLLESKEVWLLATGAAKAGIVRRLIHGPADISVPASLMQHHPNCCLFLDADAVSGL
ncbi:MAG: glucosamine-6-phosphate deaminase [Verrucomicrobia bacterium]|nr:glucosamine-6-phosphate deaminase [Verrucomicrobiota bacterium]